MARYTAITSLDEGLQDEDSYEEDDSRRADMNAFAVRLLQEDAQARMLLRDYLSEPAQLTWANLSRRSRYRTGGVVRILTDAAQDACESRPLYALNFADAAIDVVRVLPDDLYPGRSMCDFRGAAWKARANACRYLGRYSAAQDSLQQAEREYRRLPHPGIGLAAVGFVRASVFREQEEYDRALHEAEACAVAFEHLGLTERYVGACLLSGTILLQVGRIAEARSRLLTVLKFGEVNENHSWIGRSSQSLGRCYLEDGDLVTAFAYYTRALQSFQKAQLETEVIRAEWGIAKVLVREKPHDGIKRLAALSDLFASRDMVTDAALVSLDIIESQVVHGAFGEIGRLASHVIDVFVTAGKMSSALRALAYLKDAASAKSLTIAKIEYVRRFIVRADRVPDLLFVAPPEEPL
jgi:tetratricopeptide (TPR) repeat protein